MKRGLGKRDETMYPAMDNLYIVQDFVRLRNTIWEKARIFKEKIHELL